MIDNIKKCALIGLGIALILLIWYLDYINTDRDNLANKLENANKEISLLNNRIEKTKQEITAVRQLDSDYQEKLKNAQIENDKLRDDLINNVKRVYVKADCPAVPTTSTPTSRIDARPTELTREARQDYLYLRLEIQQTINQVKGLQDYINNICLK